MAGRDSRRCNASITAIASPQFPAGELLMKNDKSAPAGIRVQRFGSGDRQAVALHCSLAHGGVWSAMCAALDEPLNVAAIDLPGHGGSADWGGTGDYLNLCARAAAGFIDGPVDLIGHSGGAVAALQCALMMPDHVRSLTLIEPVLFAAARGTPEWDDWAAAMAPFARARAAGDMMAAAEVFVGYWGTGRPWAETPADGRRYLADRIPLIHAAMPALADDNFGLLAEEALEGLDLPVMIIVGGASPPVVGRIAENIAARLPDVGLAEVPGAGHMLPLTHPVQVAGLVDINLSRD